MPFEIDLGFAARNTRNEKPRPFSSGSTRAVASNAGYRTVAKPFNGGPKASMTCSGFRDAFPRLDLRLNCGGSRFQKFIYIVNHDILKALLTLFRCSTKW